MNITAALCVPLMLGNTVAAYLYLDSRGGTPGQNLRRNASAVWRGAGPDREPGTGQPEAHGHGTPPGGARIGPPGRGGGAEMDSSASAQQL